MYDNGLYFADNGDIKQEISGIGADRLESESAYLHVIEGEVADTKGHRETGKEEK